MATTTPWRGSSGHRLLTPLELPRSAAEMSALVASAPLLLAAPRGDGHPVLVVSGLSGGGGWTALLRNYVRSLGYAAHGPRFAATKGTATRVRRLLGERIEELADRHGGPVSVVAWSVGGCHARQVATERPDLVRQVICLGTPLDGVWYAPDQARAAGPLAVPSTAIVSRTDGIFDWRRCLQPGSPRAENVEVPSSHLGMASNPFVYHVVADRLAQAPGSWRPYASRRG